MFAFGMFYLVVFALSGVVLLIHVCAIYRKKMRMIKQGLDLHGHPWGDDEFTIQIKYFRNINIAALIGCMIMMIVSQVLA